jgi:hypothetical protein
MMRNYALGLLIATLGISAAVYADCCKNDCNKSCCEEKCCSTKCYPSCCKSGCCPTECCKPCGDCACEASSKTYFFVRPLYQSVRPELISGFRNERARARQDGVGGALDFVLFGSDSTKGKKLASYFMPDCKTTLVVSEKNNGSFTPDLLATNFNVNTVGEAYTGTICFSMHESVLGLGLHYKQRFAWNNDETEGWWFSVSAPIQRVSNKVCMFENSNSADLEAVNDESFTSMCEAFNQPAWNYGRIAANNAMRKTGLADIEAKLGYEWLICDGCHFASYFGALFPTGNRPCGRYLFEPIVGHGKFWGAMWGAEGGYRIWEQEEKDRNISVEYAIHSQYLFKHVQRRSFDLKHNPWSRYLLVYKNFEDANAGVVTPGINVFTRDVKVTPRFSHNMTAAFVLTCGGFQGEAGTNIFCRQAECVKLNCPWPTNGDAPALVGSGPEKGHFYVDPYQVISGNPQLASLSFDITDNQSLYEEHIIKPCDLDLRSATHPTILSYMIYGALGYRWDDREYPIHINGGASYEFASKVNTILNRWTIWGKIGFAF